MPFSEPTSITFGDGADASSSTELGVLTLNTDGSFTIQKNGALVQSFLADERDRLRSRLQAAMDEYSNFGTPSETGARLWDVSDDVDDSDPKRVQLNENSGTITMFQNLGVEYLIATIEGLLLAL